MTKLLVYRFSAMGDVILLLPVLKGVLDANTDVEIYLLTQPGFFPFFKNIDRLHLVGADLKAKFLDCFHCLIRLEKKFARIK